VGTDTNKIEDYLKDRVDEQIEWYSKKSGFCKKQYYFCKIAVVALAALLPVCIALLYRNELLPIAASIISALIIIAEGVLSLLKSQENWIEYRKIAETLKHEKYMFIHHAGVYLKEDIESVIFSYFVERIESIISQENINWAGLNKSKEEK